MQERMPVPKGLREMTTPYVNPWIPTHYSATDGSPARVYRSTPTAQFVENEDGDRWTDPPGSWIPYPEDVRRTSPPRLPRDMRIFRIVDNMTGRELVEHMNDYHMADYTQEDRHNGLLGKIRKVHHEEHASCWASDHQHR